MKSVAPIPGLPQQAGEGEVSAPEGRVVVRAALLDAAGVYLRIDELADESALTELHVPAITECDLPPGKYRWVADKEYPNGGAFWPVKYLAQVEADNEAVARAGSKADNRAARLSLRAGQRADKLAAKAKAAKP